MRIGIIGAGAMGRTLARRWAERGHQIYLGARAPLPPGDPDLPAYRSLGVEVLDPYDAAGADVVVLAVPAAVAAEVAAELDDFEGRVLIDCSQPNEPGARSVASQVAAAAMNARVVKALNVLDARTLSLPGLADERPSLPICGDDEDARDLVCDLVWGLGTSPMDVGGLEIAGMLEHLGALRRHLSALGHGRCLAFGVKDLERLLVHLPSERRQSREQRPPVR